MSNRPQEGDGGARARRPHRIRHLGVQRPVAGGGKREQVLRLRGGVCGWVRVVALQRRAQPARRRGEGGQLRHTHGAAAGGAAASTSAPAKRVGGGCGSERRVALLKAFPPCRPKTAL
jgi:hypothetical protein